MLPHGDHEMLTMTPMKCRHALDAVDHVAGDLSVNFSTEIHCHSVIRNVRLCRIMNVIFQKKMRCLSVTPPKIRFSATVQTKPHATISSREIEIPAKLDISFSVQTISSLYLLKLNLVYIISSRNRQAKHQLDDRNVYSTM